MVPEQTDTLRLLDQVRSGRLGAADELFAQHREYLHDVISLRMDERLRSRVDVSDIIQETHMEALRRLDEFLTRRPMPFRIWLRRTAHECLLRIRRRHVVAQRRSVKREVPLPDRSSVLLGRHFLAEWSTPSQQLAEEELARRVREALVQLSDVDHEILLMRTFEGLSNQEVAQVLDIEPDTTRKRYGRALLRLRRTLVEGGFDE